ncbi:hypothetical protein LINPERHAP1_LOCUS36494, partial [Linum perenne]
GRHAKKDINPIRRRQRGGKARRRQHGGVAVRRHGANSNDAAARQRGGLGRRRDQHDGGGMTPAW